MCMVVVVVLIVGDTPAADILAFVDDTQLAFDMDLAVE